MKGWRLIAGAALTAPVLLVETAGGSCDSIFAGEPVIAGCGFALATAPAWTWTFLRGHFGLRGYFGPRFGGTR
jgi:hypothetical protein